MFDKDLERFYSFYKRIQKKSEEAWERFQKQLKKEDGKTIFRTYRKGEPIECELTEDELLYIKKAILGGNTLAGLEIRCKGGKYLTLLYHQITKKWIAL